MPADVAGAALPRLGDEVERRVRQLADRVHVLGPWITTSCRSSAG